MPHRAHLFSLRLCSAFRESCLTQRYGWKRFSRDLIAGITVGIIAIPLAMALAIASGVPPQNGLYTAMIAGLVIALTGGSRLSVSGPTAAFVVILYPVVQKFGLSGLLVATLMAGVMLVGMALLRLGRLIEYISESVTVGFTSGIAVVIATLQVKDVFGLPITTLPDSYSGKISALVDALPQTYWPSVWVAGATLFTMIIWPRLKAPIPSHLPAVVVGTGLSLLLHHMGWSVDTIGSRFHYVLANGAMGQGIPPFLPHFAWPWLQAGADGVVPDWSWRTVQALLPVAFAIAMLGAIESLLCAVVLDNMTSKRHSANSELLGQGIGNIIVPFFGGITATAAIARSAANFKAGAESPVSAMVHAGVVLLGLLFLSPLLSYLPMATMAALLLMVAWGMGDARKVIHIIRKAPRGDVFVFITCFSLTVLIDMVTAISIGIMLASLLFVREIAAMTKISDITHNRKRLQADIPKGWRVIKINGPLFFAAADRIFGELAMMSGQHAGLVLYMDGVTLLDAGGLSSMQKFIEQCQHAHTKIIIADLQPQPLKTLHRGRVKFTSDVMLLPTLEMAVQHLTTLQQEQ